ncbi:MAG TPA: DUF3040 domain-containing protein [Streptosporangiaceae bacterium]|nr:DUF3040 domain-containing protein [Streptosporangiaceae bacterium]
MALSQDEQRVLAEIERRLAAEDPGLASCLTTFRRPRPTTVLRSPRARIIGSLFTVALVAMVSLMVYAMIPFRAHGARPPAAPSAAVQDRTTVLATGSTNHHGTQQAATTASGGVADPTSFSTPNSSAAPSTKATTVKAHGTATSQATGTTQATGRSAPSTSRP